MKKYLFSLVTFLFIVGVFIYATGQMSERANMEGALTLEKAIKRSSVQCYAMEGRYPSSVAYLVKNYGLQISGEKYAVFYEGFASNIMPDITVTLR